MRYLFVDNFRGFTNTVLPIKDVNFFVGENSTGKTSLLALFNIISSHSFWHYPEFNTEEFELGGFQDIVSADASDNTFFRIGGISTSKAENRTESKDELGYLMTFKGYKGIPVISRYSLLNNGILIHVKFSSKAVYYKYEGQVRLGQDVDSIKRAFLHWADVQDTRGYTKLRGLDRTRDERLDRISISYISEMVNNAIRKKVHGLPRSEYFVSDYRRIIWLAPIRTKPKRTYESYRTEFSPEGSHTPHLIRELLSSKKTAKGFLSFIERVGRNSGLLKSISVKQFGPGLPGSFELDVTLNKEELNVVNVGYGVSQALPVVVELYARPRGVWFAIQQPEVHLHPRAQLTFGDVVFQLAIRDNKKFIIETHSDYAIDGFRLNFRKKNLKNKPDSQVVFFERASQGNVLFPLQILEDGQLSGVQPKSYREFFLNHEFKVLDL